MLSISAMTMIAVTIAQPSLRARAAREPVANRAHGTVTDCVASVVEPSGVRDPQRMARVPVAPWRCSRM